MPQPSEPMRSPVSDSNPVLLYWEKLISQYGRKAGESRHIAKDIMRGPAEMVVLGAEYQPPDAQYSWNGLCRQTPVRKRWFAFQWTIQGEGELRVGKEIIRQPENTAFAVQIPSDHEYRVARSGPGWKFLFVRIDDVYLTDRLCREAVKSNWSFAMPPGCRLAAETISLFEKGYGGTLQDEFEVDRATYNWCVEFRSHIHNLLHPRDKRLQMLATAEAFFQENKTRSFGVEDFAASIGMTRSQASVHFHKLTGQTPANYFLELKLHEAIALLREGYKLDYIARETGFSDANHLCKSFKRVFRVTPGQYRRQRWPSVFDNR